MGLEKKPKTLTTSCQLKNIDSGTRAAIVWDYHSTKILSENISFTDNSDVEMDNILIFLIQNISVLGLIFM